MTDGINHSNAAGRDSFTRYRLTPLALGTLRLEQKLANYKNLGFAARFSASFVRHLIFTQYVLLSYCLIVLLSVMTRISYRG